MIDDNVKNSVCEIEEAMPGAVWVDSAGSYEAFTNGKLLFDIEPEPQRLKNFCDSNRSEFGGSIAAIRSITWSGMQIHFTYNVHLHQKRVQQNELWDLERQNPELFTE